jgi:hypothetical protein
LSFPTEYYKIAILNIDLNKQYQRERDTNDAPDNVINNLISFDPGYIKKETKLHFKSPTAERRHV